MLREKFMDILKDIKKLYNDGVLVLNSIMVEKLKLYLHKDKVIKAAGVDPIAHLRET